MFFLRQNFRRIFGRLLIFFAVFGPATITAISDNDAAGVATYSLAGANYGYSILFILLLSGILLSVTQEMGVRIAIVARKGLGDLIRERYGIKASLVIFSALLIANTGTVIADYSALKTVSHMFNFSPLLLIALVTIFSILFVTKGNYRTNQRIFLLGIILYFSYVISAFKANPDWSEAIKSFIVPIDLKLTKEFIISSIAVLGTTITPWGQFFIQSFMNDKKVSSEGLKYAQFEVYFGTALTIFFSFSMIVATAATLFANGVPLVSGEDAAQAIRPFAGNLASILFGIGLMNAAIMGIIIISLSTTYAFGEFFGVERSLDVSYERGKSFYGLFIFQLIVAALIVSLPFISLFKIVLYTQSLNGILLPFIFFFLLKITNNKEIMGIHTNKKWFNYFIIICSTIIILASLFTVISSIFSL